MRENLPLLGHTFGFSFSVRQKINDRKVERVIYRAQTRDFEQRNMKRGSESGMRRRRRNEATAMKTDGGRRTGMHDLGRIQLQDIRRLRAAAAIFRPSVRLYDGWTAPASSPESRPSTSGPRTPELTADCMIKCPQSGTTSRPSSPPQKCI